MFDLWFWVVLFILIVNAIIAIGYMVIKGIMRRQLEDVFAGVVMLLCPIAGIAYYLFGWLAYKFDFAGKEVYMQDVSFSKDKRLNVLFPDVEKEMEAVPLEELFIVSNNEDKRKSLLEKLKHDFDKSLGSISKALDNEDAETSHYAASAIMNKTSDFISTLKELGAEYEKDREDYDINREYADYIYKYLKSGIMNEIETKRYGFQYFHAMDNMQTNHPDMITSTDTTRVVDMLLDLGEFRMAEKWAKHSMQQLDGSESSYLNLLKVYYRTGQTEMFFLTLEQLKLSAIPLSQTGLELVRFFTQKKAVRL